MAHKAVPGERLTIYCTEEDRHDGRPLYEWLLALALKRGMAGATATRGLAGFGQHQQVHHQHLLELADVLPVVVQLVDDAERVEGFIQAAEEALRRYTYIREEVRWHRPEPPGR